MGPLLVRTVLLVASVVALSPAFAAGQASLRVCQQAVATLKSDSNLADALRAAFGEPGFTEDEDCLYPLQVLRFADVDVLVTQNLAPETACQTCEADLSATVLKRIPGGFKSVRTFVAFGKTGTATSIAPITIGGDDGLAIESSGTNTGYVMTTLALYAFRRQGLVELDAGGPLYIAGDNSGAATDESKAVTVDAAWSLAANNELTIDYRVSEGGAEHQSRAVWTAGEAKLTPKSGGVPKEMARAVGEE
jgi:hypothetical protein